jgi:hypothetical protein
MCLNSLVLLFHSCVTVYSTVSNVYKQVLLIIHEFENQISF